MTIPTNQTDTVNESASTSVSPSPSFEELIKSRRSIRKYDQTAPFNHEAVSRSLALAILSPNSSNMQMWAFHRVISNEKRQQLAKICMGQNAAKTANELVVFVVTPNVWKQRVKLNASKIRQNFETRSDSAAIKAVRYYEKLIPFIYRNDRFGILGVIRKLFCHVLGLRRPMVREVSKADLRVCLHKSVSLAAMTFMTAMRNEGYDTCPMEGFDSARAKKLLGLSSDEEISMIISCGKRIDAGIYGERHRVELEDIVFKH